MDRLFAILVRRCSEPLKMVRTIASQLRTSPTPASVTPSRFIGDVFKPYHQLLDGNPPLLKAYSSEYSRRTLDGILNNYTTILASVKKTEDLLRRHRKGKKNTFSLFGSSTVNDEGEEERFVEQMTIDIHALANAAKGLGLEVDDLASYAELLDVVQRKDG
jgi:hypothetical protein